MSSPIVAQALVTDPGGGRSAGYALVARSSSLTHEDADTLQTRPEVSNELHEGLATARYRSFFPLGNGTRWALMTRLIRGTRRGGYNRVVAHALVLPQAALEACAWDPFVVLECRFVAREAPGPEWSGGELADIAADETETLPDLRMIPTVSPETTRERCLAAQLACAAERPGPGVVESLAWIYAVLRTEQGRVLLYDSDADRALLAAAWESLPAADRRCVPWTEHLAPGMEFDFRLACAPDPLARVQSGELGQRWLVHGQEAEILASDRAARTLAERLAGAGASAASVARELEEHDIRVLKGDTLLRWADWTGWQEWDVNGQFSVDGLLRRVARDGRIHTWESRGTVLTRITSDLEQRSRGASADLDELAKEDVAVLARHGVTSLLAPGSIRDAQLKPGLIPYALLLAVHASQSSSADFALPELADLFSTVPGDHPTRRHTALLLAWELLTRDQPDPTRIRRLRLAGSNLAALAERLGDRGGTAEPALLALFEVESGGEGNEHRAAVAKALLEIWSALPENDTTRPLGLEPALEALADNPQAVATTFRDLSGPRLERAITFLRRAAQSDRRRAKEIVDAAAPLVGTLRTHPAWADLAERLVDLGASVQGCMAFAIAEAMSIDSVEAFRARPPAGPWLAGVRSVPPDAAKAVLASLAQTRDVQLGPRSLALFRIAIRSVETAPDTILPVVRAAARGEAHVLGAWDDAVCDAIRILHDPGAERSARVAWLRGHADRGKLPLSDRTRALIPELEPSDQREVVEAWRARMRELETADPSTLDTVEEIVTSLPGSGFEFHLRKLEKQVERGDLPRFDALLAANRASVHTDDPSGKFELACERLLPKSPVECGPMVLEAMAHAEMWPTSLRVLNRRLPEVFRFFQAGELARIAQRGPSELAHRAASELGLSWRRDVVATLDFVRHVFAHGDWLLYRAFVAASASRGEPAFPEGLEEAARGSGPSMRKNNNRGAE